MTIKWSEEDVIKAVAEALQVQSATPEVSPVETGKEVLGRIFQNRLTTPTIPTLPPLPERGINA